MKWESKQLASSISTEVEASDPKRMGNISDISRGSHDRWQKKEREISYYKLADEGRDIWESFSEQIRFKLNLKESIGVRKLKRSNMNEENMVHLRIRR